MVATIKLIRASRLIVHVASLCISAWYFVIGLGGLLFLNGWRAKDLPVLLTLLSWFPTAALALRRPRLAALIQLFFCLPVLLLTLAVPFKGAPSSWGGYARAIGYCIGFGVLLLALYPHLQATPEKNPESPPVIRC